MIAVPISSTVVLGHGTNWSDLGHDHHRQLGAQYGADREAEEALHHGDPVINRANLPAQTTSS